MTPTISMNGGKQGTPLLRNTENLRTRLNKKETEKKMLENCSPKHWHFISITTIPKSHWSMGFLLCKMLKPMTSTPWDCNNAFKVITRAIRKRSSRL
jgi:hypothetical protein